MVVEDGMDWLKIVVLFVIGLAIILAFSPKLINTITSVFRP